MEDAEDVISMGARALKHLGDYQGIYPLPVHDQVRSV